MVKQAEREPAEPGKKLEPYQDKYVFSTAKFPALVAAWGTGKSLCLITRAMLYSEEIPNNLGVIYRKEYTDLRDSTIRDFELYTGYKVDSSRNVRLKNGSVIMFRHLEEINSIQNMNLGWYGFEQAEEQASDHEFFFLWGRLRRKIEPTPFFKGLGLPYRTGFIVANVAGNNWIKKLWKNPSAVEEAKRGGRFELIEATTFDNRKNLTQDFLDTLEVLRDKKPQLYRRFVLNDWDAELESKVFKNVQNCVAGTFEEPRPGFDYVMGVDLAKSQDFTVIVVICRQTKHVVYFERLESDNRTSWSFQKARIEAVAKKYNEALAVIDSTGVGDPIVEDLQRAGVGVYHEPTQKGEGESVPGVKFTNIVKEELVERLVVALETRLITFPDIAVLIDELLDFQCEMLPSRKIRYTAPEGKHDDTVFALALALRGIEGGMYQAEYVEPTEPTNSEKFWARVKRDKERYNELHRTEDQEHLVTDDGAREIEA